MSKVKIWFAIWGLSIVVGSALTIVAKILNTLNHMPFEQYRQILPFYLSFVLLPLLCISNYHARKEKNKAITIISSCLIFHHVLCLVAELL